MSEKTFDIVTFDRNLKHRKGLYKGDLYVHQYKLLSFAQYRQWVIDTDVYVRLPIYKCYLFAKMYCT